MVVWSDLSSQDTLWRLSARFPWVICTPFGSEVEPDVYWRKASWLDWLEVLVVLVRVVRYFLDGGGRVSVVIQVSLVGQGVWDFPIMFEKASLSEASFFM